MPNSGKNIINIFFYLLALSLPLSIGATWIIHSLLLLYLIYKIIKEKNWNKTPLDYIILIYIISQIIPAIFSPYPEETLKDWGKLFSFTMFFIATNLFRKENTKKFILFFLTGVSISSIYATIKFITGDEARAAGFTGGWGTLGFFTSFAAIFSLILLLEEKKWYYFIHLILSLSGMTLTLSRSNIVAFAVSSFIYFSIFRKKYIITFIIFLTIGFFISPDSAKKRLIDTIHMKGNWSSGRITIWKEGIKLFKKKPLLGWGRHTIRKIMPEKAWDKIGDRGIGNWHNEWLQNLLDSGIIGFLCWIILL